MKFTLFGNLPNLITLGRLLLVPAIVALIAAERWKEAFVCFIIAGASDALDGWIAKTFDLRTQLGAYLDPIADKALIVSIYIALAIIGVIPATIAIIVVARDIMIVGAFMISWFLDRPVEVRPLAISKINTLAQISICDSRFVRPGVRPRKGRLAPAFALRGGRPRARLASRLFQPMVPAYERMTPTSC